MVVQEARPSGALVVEAERISKAYEGSTIVRDFSLRIMRGDRIGIIGAERRRQDDADQSPDRRLRARRRRRCGSDPTCRW